MDYVQSRAASHPYCKVVYLHVEASNTNAIDFYCKRNFMLFTRVPGYYHIKGRPADGLLYISFINGGIKYDGSLGSWWQRNISEQNVCACLISGPARFIRALLRTDS